jgi:hypothetical protein
MNSKLNSYALVMAASLMLAIALQRFAGEGGYIPDVVAGWFFAAATFAAGHFLLFYSKKTTDQPLLPLGVIALRLFFLIIIFLAVLVYGIFRAGPFAIGMLCGYLVAGWMEIGALARNLTSRAK